MSEAKIEPSLFVVPDTYDTTLFAVEQKAPGGHERRPRFTEAEATKILCQSFGIEVAEMKQFPSYDDQNFYVRDPQNSKFMLKCSNSKNTWGSLDLRNQVSKKLTSENFNTSAPVKSLTGRVVVTAKDSQTPEQYFYIFLLNYIEGEVLRHAPKTVWTGKMLQTLGETAATFDKIIGDIEHPCKVRDDDWDLDVCYKTVSDHLKYVKNEKKNQLIRYYISVYEDYALQLVSDNTLRKSLIHMDLNEMNILLKGDGTSVHHFAVIDLEQMLYSTTVNEIAVCVAYMLAICTDNKTQTLLATAALITKGYHKIIPLSDDELRIVLPLAMMRACVSLVMSTYDNFKDPDNEYILICQKGFWMLLESFSELDFEEAYKYLKTICNA